ncbi:hypothetical protein L195_g029468 [Trifolium pratense]|uniref:Uncharacterized protein n=1 Tax=Trifolium pratense TaxID=57577 RepID=A0A2K3L4W8_TRIPR|nr:hypothetical protein L195_g029468 [Trifolium pratense]
MLSHPPPRYVNGAGIERMLLYHSLFHHLKCFPSPSSFPALGNILPPSPSTRILTVPTEIHQP